MRLPGEVLCPRQTGVAARLPARGVMSAVLEERRHACGPARDVADRTIRRRRAADFVQDGRIAGHDRCAARQRLGDGQREPFAIRGLQHERGPSIDRRKDAVIDERHFDDVAVQAQRAGQTALRGRERAADLDQPQARMRLPECGDDVEQDVDALARDRAADVQQLEAIVLGRTEKRDGFAIGAGIGSRAARRVYAVRHHHDTLSWNHCRRDQLVARRGAHTQDLLCRSHSLEQQPAERAFDDRAFVEPGNTPRKASKIVARDDRPAGRQSRRQMRVAMVDDMEEVEVGGASNAATSDSPRRD